MSLPTEDKSYVSKTHMLDDIVVLLGGRVSEALILGDISTGASNDLERATKLARDMVTRYGMSDVIGPLSLESGSHEVFLGRDYSSARAYSETVAAQVDEEIKRIVNDGYARCEAILTCHEDQLHLLAKYLIKHEKIDGDTFKRLLETGSADEALPADNALQPAAETESQPTEEG